MGNFDPEAILKEHTKISWEKVDRAMCPLAVRNHLPDKHIYKVPFEQAHPLVMKRQVVVFNGAAYLLHVQLEEIFVSIFQSKLTAASIRAFIACRAEEDERLTPILRALASFTETEEELAPQANLETPISSPSIQHGNQSSSTGQGPLHPEHDVASSR
eukprot:m.26907 g.26907  ORF g.26907 m.26907 type:complete len:158 (-) comp39106_c0_seq1:107-580(-)